MTHPRQLSTKNYCAVLGLESNANPAEIKKAHLQLVKKHHPDMGGDPEKFREIQEAYEAWNEEKEIAHSSYSERHFEKRRSYFQRKTNDNSSFSSIAFFYDLEAVLTNKDKSLRLKLLMGLGKEKLCRLLKESDFIALLFTNVLESDREKLVDLIGRDHIAQVLDLRDLFMVDRTYYKVRTNSEINFNRNILAWDEYIKLFKILGHDTVLKCLKCDISWLLMEIRMSCGKERCDQFIDYLGIKHFSKFISRDVYSLNNILPYVSNETQENLLLNLEPGYIESNYQVLVCVICTLKFLHPSHHQLFLNIIGKDNLEKLINVPMDPKYIEDFENILKEQAKPHEHSIRPRR